jgi:putative acetyltransferase
VTRASGLSLRAYRADDEDAAIALWLRTWQATYPGIDFAARLDWWRKRWRDELLPTAKVVIAEDDGEMIGFVTIDTGTHYLDQLVVAPEYWGLGTGFTLVDEAKRLSGSGVDLDVNVDNARAIAFYGKCGFVITGDGKNPITGRPIHRMSWQPRG